ncbi:MAG: hypothetical protein V1728_02545 [Candidatus Micrarchaeota archaeon]
MARSSRAQLTAEALMLMAITLSILVVAAFSISKMQNWEQSLFEKKVLTSELDGIISYADEICVLGPGNSRVMSLAPVGFTLDGTDHELTLNAAQGSLSMNRESLCNVEPDGNTVYSNKIYLWYDGISTYDGRTNVRISPNPPT